MPKDEPTALIFADDSVPDRRLLRRLWLDVANGPRAAQPLANGTGRVRALEMSHRNRTVCAIGAQLPIVCYAVDAPERRWSLPMPDMFSANGLIDVIRLDWTSGNWYLQSRAVGGGGAIVVCNAAMRFCTSIVESVEVPLLSLALDPTKG